MDRCAVAVPRSEAVSRALMPVSSTLTPVPLTLVGFTAPWMVNVPLL